MTSRTMLQSPGAPELRADGMESRRLQLIARSASTRPMATLGANRVLAAVPSAALQRISAHFESVNLAAGDVLHEAGCRLRHAYFPTTAIASLVCETADGASGEICAVGNDGVVGLELFMGGDMTFNRAVVTSAGHAFRMESRHLEGDSGATALLGPALLRYTQALITQIAQTAVCNRHHSAEQRLCRRLLFSLDHLPAGDLLITQGQIADMLGVRRESVTMAAGKLQSAGVIQCSRGRIRILDRPGLELRACDCCRETSGRCAADGPRVARKVA